MNQNLEQLKDVLSAEVVRIYAEAFGEPKLKKALAFLKTYNTEFLLGQSRLNRSKNYEKGNEKDLHALYYTDAEFMQFYNDSLFLSYAHWKNHNAMLRYFIKIVRKIKPETVLDVPCGSGFYTRYLRKSSRSFPHITCVDASEHSLQFAKKINRDSQNVFYLREDFRNIGGKYDFIICGELLEHLEKPKELLAFLRKRVKEDGKVFLTTALFCYAHDHIYMFRSARDVRRLLKKYFFIENELVLPVFDSQKLGHNVPTNYACLLRPIKTGGRQNNGEDASF